MDDLISRQAAIEVVIKETYQDGAYGYADAKSLIDVLTSLPSVQPEIIRCKECKHWIVGYITDQDDFIPPKCGKYNQCVGHSYDDFCNYAERCNNG